jgi:hypothetical protein
LIKFILIVLILSFIFMKVMGYVFRLLGGSQASGKARGYTQQHYNKTTPPDGNVHIDYIPDKEKKSSGKFKGGEYVDYEEVE